jgi:hypothetical protein
MNKIIKSFNTRSFVIEYSILIEELISKTLGLFLNIEWKTSVTLGYKSSALSFNQKVQIIQDLKGIENLMIKKLDCFMFIRNKFAHIREINSFEKLFTISKSGDDVKKNLNKWYSKPADSTNSFEHIFIEYFTKLSSEIIDFLSKISTEHAYEQGYQKGQNDTHAKISEELALALRKYNGGQQILDDVFKKIKEESKKK